MGIRRGAHAALGCLVVLTMAACGTTHTLRSTDVAKAISTGLSAQVGGAFTVTCPTGVAAQDGVSFSCTVVDASDGSTFTVTVVQSDDTGGFDWRTSSPAPS